MKKGKMIAQFTLEGDLVSMNYRSYYKEKGWPVSNISKCCNGKLKTCKGYVWRYVETEDGYEGD